jgi:phosphate-selective porin OprO and OprP
MQSFKNHRFIACKALLAAVTFLIFSVIPVSGQSSSSTMPPAEVDYFFPDMPPDVTKFDVRSFNIRVGFVVLADYTFIGQNSTSRAQVNPQASKPDLRAGRFALSGQIKFKRPWTYVIAGDFNEVREDSDKIFEPLDYALTIPLWKKARISIGKQKEPFVYEMVGDAANLPQQERILSPFFATRNIGIRYLDNYLNDRMSFNVGIYNDWYESGLSLRENGTQISSRLTGLPIDSVDGRKFLHLGVGFRHVGADNGELRYKGRPESNVTDNYVDTGKFPAKYANQLSLESLLNSGSFSLLTDYARAWVQSPERGNPIFSGYYFTGSYVLTGETRPYDKKVGYARRVIPKSRWGAVELVGRFGHLDIDDSQVAGGKLSKWYGGVNWWASRQWKIGTGYGLADLERFNTTGRTHMLLTRVQWIY